jgi:hypothetical protein
MKKTLGAIGLLLITILSYSQTWTYHKSENAFDGSIKTSSVEGVGYEFPYTKPIFVINVFNGDKENPNVYLSKVPYSGCDNNKVLVRFDKDEKIYKLLATSNKDNEQWFLNFSSNYIPVVDSVQQEIIYYVVKKAPIRLRVEPNPNAKFSYEVPVNDTLVLFSVEDSYWTCMYKNRRLYFNTMYAGDAEKTGIRTGKKIYVPILKQVQVDSEFQQFLQDCKTHSKMSVRILSDCVRSDFEFSLKGSTAAINFVFQ